MKHFYLTTISSGEDWSPSRFASLPAGLLKSLLKGKGLGHFFLFLQKSKISKYLLTFLRLINCCLVRIARQEADETQREETANFLCFLQGLDFDFEYFIEQNKFKRKKL